MDSLMFMERNLLKRSMRFFYRVRYEWIGRQPKYAESLAAAREARTVGDWGNAAVRFEQALRARPNSGSARLGLAHSLKELGRLGEAETVYREAVKRSPKSADAYVGLGHVLNLSGKSDEAAIAYAGGVKLRAKRPLAESAEQWSKFRSTLVTPPVPGIPNATPFKILVDGRGIGPSILLAMIRGLNKQSETTWRAFFLVDSDVMNHSVASRMFHDNRFSFFDDITAFKSCNDTDNFSEIVTLTSGAILTPLALQWLRFASRQLPTDAIYADHDYHHQNRYRTPRYFSPILYPAPARIDIETCLIGPSVCHFSRLDWNTAIDTLRDTIKGDWIKTLIRDHLDRHLHVRHIPLVLSSVCSSAAIISDYPPQRDTDPNHHHERITVVIPTRDEHETLEACIISLTKHSDRIDLLDILVLDNRSQQEKTFLTFERISSNNPCKIIPADEPFNWSRLNNIGARHVPEGIILFANNDIEMLSSGWDTRLRETLADPDVGVVGARLLYPDGTLQHSGVVMGGISGRPIHEGRGTLPSDGGPLNRWKRSREVAAVTGAFLAVRHDVFERAGGFEEDLAIAYNDLDFCLKVRACGLSVVYCAEIEALHYESKTRGFALTSEKASWDDEEFQELSDRWGRACTTDPYVNPMWTFSSDRSFESIRELTASEATASIEGDFLIRHAG
ncbi:tetratricopeptide repeat protein [Brevundimonas nasdae]|uniref:tetratricopeptide repeat protein n=1 Tax=Brevundimonas nasdae TaxID=172043 RepID=UPI00289F354B|nr:tetratricopeptide repeat protein [Brevundimonas nasdae]